MSVKEQMGYALVCDFPGCGTETGDVGEYAFWGDLGDAIEEWRDADGVSDESGTFCAEHTVWSEPDEHGDDERVGMPYTIENLFVLAERHVAEVIERATRNALIRQGDLSRRMESNNARRMSSLERRWMREGGIRRQLVERLAARP